MADMTDEQSADFAALSAAASEPNASHVQQETQAAAQTQSAAQSMAAEIKALIELALTVLTPALPSLKTIYTPEINEAASQAIAAVCVKHGWMAGGLFKEWGEEIGAAAILLPLAYTTMQGVKGDLATAKKKQGIHQGATMEGVAVHQPEEAAQGAKTVQFGNVGPA